MARPTLMWGALALGLGLVTAACDDGDSGGDPDTSPTADAVDDAAADSAPEGGADAAEALSCPADSVAFERLDVGGLALNVGCQGAGPTLVLLHGFPEFWFGWDSVIGPLAADYRVVVPDQRGYNLSDIPPDVTDYDLDLLVEDIVGLLDAIGEDRAVLVGHDWGGAVAWAFGTAHPERLRGLVILNAPHPDVFRRELTENPDQQAASGYMTFFRSDSAEAFLSANDYAGLATAMGGVVEGDDLDRYREAWDQPGALTGMLNWYRANIDPENPFEGEDPVVVTVPTLVLWGMQDQALLPGNLVGLEDYVADLEIEEVEDATHWIVHEQPDVVMDAIRAFEADLP